MKAVGEVRVGPPVQRSSRKQGNGVVDPYFAKALALNEIVDPTRMVTDIRQLHPMDAGIKLVEEKGWERVEEAAGVRTYYLWNRQKALGFQKAVFNETTGETSLRAGFMTFGQVIQMNKEGRVTRDTGRFIS